MINGSDHLSTNHLIKFSKMHVQYNFENLQILPIGYLKQQYIQTFGYRLFSGFQRLLALTFAPVSALTSLQRHHPLSLRIHF